MMSQLTIIGIFFVTLVVALLWGVRWAYVWVFLPVLLMLNQLPQWNLPHLTVTAPYAPMYAMLIALPFRPEPFRFRWCWTDTIVVALVLSATLTGLLTEYAETAVNALRNETTRLALPYFFARAVFRDWPVRRAGARMLAGLTLVIAACAVWECLRQPNFYLHLLRDRLAMGNPIHPMAMNRFGLNRVSGTVEHPIFFGNMALLSLGLIAVLARTGGVRLRTPLIAAGLAAAVACVGMSISFTPWMGLFAGSIAMAVLMSATLARQHLVVPMTLAVIAGLAGYSAYLIATPLADAVESTADRSQLEGSAETRKLILHQSWPLARTAGWFGWGLQMDFDDVEGFDLASVDNSYMQFTMTRGWVYTALWVGIGLTFALRVQRAFRLVTDRPQAFPLAVCTATVLGLMVAMYTVWAGAIYAVVWIIMLGLAQTLVDQVLDAAEARAAFPVAVGPLRPPVVRRLPVGYGV